MITVIMSLSLPGPLEEKKSTSQKIDVPKSLLKLPAHLQEQLCFRVVKMASYLRPEYKSVKAKTLGECWRRNYFYYSLAKMTLAEQREFISNYLSRRASDYDKFMSRNEHQFQSVVSRPTFRHTKAKHEVQRLCRETGPTSSPQVMVILLQAACLAAAEDVQSDVMDCFGAVSEQSKNHVTKQLQLELFSKFYMLVEKAIHRACKKLELPILSKSNFLDGAKKKRSQRRSVITGEVLENIPATSLPKRRTSAEKKDYETKMQQDYYADGMPIPRRPISRIVDVRRNALDIAAAERDPTLSNDEDKWWEDALFQSSSNAARRKVQEKKQKEKERVERAKRQAIQRELELKRKKEEEEQRQIELKLWREAEEKRLAEEAERKKLEEERKRKKKQKKRGKKKKYRSQSMYATRKSKSQKVKRSVRTNSDNASEKASSTVERKNAY